MWPPPRPRDVLLAVGILAVVAAFATNVMPAIRKKRDLLREDAHRGMAVGEVFANGCTGPTTPLPSQLTLISWLPQNMVSPGSKLCADSRRSWAERHGYRFLEPTEASVSLRGGVGGEMIKPFVVNSVLDQTEPGDWVVWMDGDVLITNTSFALHRVLAAECDAMVTEGLPHNQDHVNTGVFALRKTPRVSTVAKKWMDKTGKILGGWSEQEVLIHLQLNCFVCMGGLWVIVSDNRSNGTFYVVDACTCTLQVLTHLLLAPEECDLSKMPRPDHFGFGKTRHMLSECFRRAHRKLNVNSLSTHPGNGAAGLVSTADDSRIIGLWGVNYMEEQWRRGDFLIHLAGTPRKGQFHAFARPLENQYLAHRLNHSRNRGHTLHSPA